MLTTDQKGNIAEVAIALAAIKLGIDVYWPVGEGGRYDLILDVCGRLNRVQCKWAPRKARSLSFGATQQGETGTVCCDESTSKARLMHMPPIVRRSTAASSCLTGSLRVGHRFIFV